MAHHVHSLNSSPSHQKYSFSKAQRISYQKPRTDIYYLPKMEKDNRSALIGYGARSLGSINQKTYAQTPHAYNIPSTINVKKGPSFSSGRHEIGGPLQSVRFSKQIPGPLNYSLKSELDHRGGKIGVKLKDFSLKYFESLPGPGSYNLPSSVEGSNQNGKSIFQSRYSNAGSYRIGKLSNSLDLSRRKAQKFQTPGPGLYDVQKYGINNPENPFSKNSSVKFSKERRNQLAKRGAQKQPGPGQYKIYSEFD